MPLAWWKQVKAVTKPEVPSNPSEAPLETLPEPTYPHFHSQLGGLWTDLSNSRAIVEGKRALGAISDGEASLLNHWIEWGYVVLPQAVSNSTIDAVLEDLDRTLDGTGTPRHASYWSQTEKCFETATQENMVKNEAKLLDLHATSHAVQDALFAEPIRRFLHLIFDRPALAFQSLTFLYGSQQPVHQDTAFVTVSSPLELAASWIALEDIQPGSGELLYYPGSHRLPEVLFSGSKAMPSNYTEGYQYEKQLHERAERFQLSLEPFRPRKGDALIWSADLIHGGAKIQQQGLTRKSLVVHYCPIDVRPTYFGTEAELQSQRQQHESGDWFCSST